MEKSGNTARGLLDQPWVPVEISNTLFLVKVSFGNTAYQLLISDLDFVWYESVDTNTLEQRAQELNRRLKASVVSFFQQLCAIAQPKLEGHEETDSAATFSCERVQDGLTLHMKSELAGVPFYWRFSCSPASVRVICQHLVHPFLAISRFLQEQTLELGTLLKRKDDEIQDYKENGAVLSRDRLKTELFQQQAFNKLFFLKKLPEICAVQDCRGFTREIQELYVAVTTMGSRQKRKHEDSEDTSTQVSQEVSKSISTQAEQAQKMPFEHLAEEKCKEEEGGTQSPLTNDTRKEMTMATATQASSQPTARPKKKSAKGLFR
ncbi:non-homologous end-joining factor 1 isoform X2 [Erpetoichthys calabaricus]|nr:non-homologous end-joining factor 1 isoform X2 [Erpetoichthys calabaricus]XP_028663067.1 non-homologous end-joining factor 1 isoform X2 [Erpetoichthys calabaricus]